MATAAAKTVRPSPRRASRRAGEITGAEALRRIRQLEEETIPWRRAGTVDGLRQTPAGRALPAAERYLRGSARSGPPGTGGSRPPGTATGSIDPDAASTAREGARQREALLRWAGKHRRLIDARLEARLVNICGVEHDVFHDDAAGRWVKITKPGKSGMELHAREELRGVTATLITGDALPASYLRRLVLANEKLGDDFCLHGVIDRPGGGLRLVVSQRHVRGVAATPAQIARHFTTAGFRQINAKAYYAHSANVFVTPEGATVPFDVGVQQPQGALLRAVSPPPTLSFDEEGEDQPALSF